jgi:hypothetical protein
MHQPRQKGLKHITTIPANSIDNFERNIHENNLNISGNGCKMSIPVP